MAIAELEVIPLQPVAIFLRQEIFVGATINALAALGEEFGFRGQPLPELSDLAIWSVAHIVYLVGGAAILISPVGIAGIVAGVGVTELYFTYDQFVASSRVNDGSNLDSWKRVATDT